MATAITTAMESLFSIPPEMDTDSPAMRTMLEYHIPYLLGLTTTKAAQINPQAAYKYENDLFGLLQELGIPANLHWLTMRMNGMWGSSDYLRTMLFLYIPDPSDVEKLKSVHQVMVRKTAKK
jgi:hypothetical protein